MTTSDIYRVHSVSATGIPQFLTDLEAENFVLAYPQSCAQVVQRGVIVSVYYGTEHANA